MASVYSELAALGISYSDAMKEEKNTTNITRGNNLERGNDCVCSSKDIIVLAEFSEVKGPIPLLTVPLTYADFGVDLDDFILKIMSVDYQANASGSFRFTADTQVLQTDIIEGVHAYVHYFTLNDICARGFVRPLCLAYISRNKKKLELEVSLLRESFLQVSGVMKEENRCLFLEEVSLGLQRLKNIQYRYFQWRQRMEEEEIEKDIDPEDYFISTVNLDQLVEQQNEFNKILQSARSVLENTHLYEALSPWKDSFSVSTVLEIDQYMTYIKLMVGHHEPLVSNQRRGDSVTDLRPIAALSPFGVAIGVWYLCQIQSHFDGCDLELRVGCFWPLDQAPPTTNGTSSSSSSRAQVQEAISCEMYRKILLHLLPTSISMPYGDYFGSVSETSESGTPIKVASGNEASSSYYSALDSTNEAIGSAKMRSSVGASAKASGDATPQTILRQSMYQARRLFCDSSDDESSSDGLEYHSTQVSECQKFPANELWSKCVWTGIADSQLGSPGNKILQFFKTFSKVAQHILYSLLIGRTVVIAGSNSLRPNVWRIISALIYFVPVEENAKYLKWHRGILVSAHIEKYKIIGLCVPERLTVHDMISPRDKNLVTILDVNSKKILGPAYSGVLLDDIRENFDKNFLCAEALILYLQSVFAGIHQKVFLYKALSLSQPKTKTSLAKDVAQALRVKGRDMDIINYLKKFIIL
ncbi:guanine nucleotide exchange protein smcr8b-like isoform X2 [Ischnura elegans]|uniref:guanine nucleotide exchange protein smcr8b-like isoform X2 n=1 Tax=Ischnura elegans TaxID=197161 RepID=UPI001ED8705C|nr:guanine nucleotide exchange protein smcr8b-like isoform X2 [Ischnura elegans]